MKLKMRSLVVVSIITLVLVLSGCSGGSNGNSDTQFVLSNLKAIDAQTLEATFNTGTKVTITEFTPKPLTKGKEMQVNFLYKGTTYYKKVTYGASVISGSIEDVTASNALASIQSLRKGSVRVIAVDESANVYATTIDSQGNFDLTVPADKSYVVMFMDSAGQFLGTFTANSGQTGLKVQNGQVNLGRISIDKIKKVVTSDRENELKDIIEDNAIKKPEDVTYTDQTKRVDTTLYFPMNDNSVMVNANASYINIKLIKVRYDSTIGKNIFVQYDYYTNKDVPTKADDFKLKYVYHMYFNKDYRMLQKKVVFNQGKKVQEEYDDFKLMPILMEKDKFYGGKSTDGYSSQYNLAEIFTDEVIGNDLNPRDAILVNYFNDNYESYTWYAKGVGIIGFSRSKSVFPEKGTSYYKKSGTKSYGQRPNWLTDQLISNLPTS